MVSCYGSDLTPYDWTIELSPPQPNKPFKYQKGTMMEYIATHKDYSYFFYLLKKGATAPQAAGVIHSDFERGFIRANIVKYKDFVEYNGLKGAKEKGLLKQEGKEYVMQEDDIVEFLFNV